MASRRRRTDPPVIERLLESPQRFDFYQAVGVLERAKAIVKLMDGPDAVSAEEALRKLDDGLAEVVAIGAEADPQREAVRFSSNNDQAFAASDIQDVSAPQSRRGRYGMLVNFIGLGGTSGPLPAPYSELVLERASRRDVSPRDFLDIFNHRLTSLMARMRRKHRFTLNHVAPHRNAFANYLFSLFGLATPGLRERMGVPDRALLSYTALLAKQPRSMSGLQILLSNYLSTPVRCEPMVGAWYPLAADQTTVLGRSGQTRRLGGGAVLGRRVWSHEWRIRLKIGPLKIEQYEALLPVGVAFKKLCALIRFYIGPVVEFDFLLLLEPDEVPGARIDGDRSSRLGWTSFLKQTKPGSVPGSVRLAAARHA